MPIRMYIIKKTLKWLTVHFVRYFLQRKKKLIKKNQTNNISYCRGSGTTVTFTHCQWEYKWYNYFGKAWQFF